MGLLSRYDCRRVAYLVVPPFDQPEISLSHLTDTEKDAHLAEINHYTAIVFPTIYSLHRTSPQGRSRQCLLELLSPKSSEELTT